MGPMRRRGVLGVIALLIACAVWTAPEAARVRGSLVVTMDEPFSIQGHVYPGGRLTLRDIGDYSPAITLHEFAVDGSRYGVLQARRDDAARPRPEPTAMFGRDAKGRLHLIGYVSMERETYRF